MTVETRFDPTLFSGLELMDFIWLGKPPRYEDMLAIQAERLNPKPVAESDVEVEFALPDNDPLALLMKIVGHEKAAVRRVDDEIDIDLELEGLFRDDTGADSAERDFNLEDELLREFEGYKP